MDSVGGSMFGMTKYYYIKYYSKTRVIIWWRGATCQQTQQKAQGEECRKWMENGESTCKSFSTSITQDFETSEMPGHATLSIFNILLIISCKV